MENSVRGPKPTSIYIEDKPLCCLPWQEVAALATKIHLGLGVCVWILDTSEAQHLL